MLPDHDARVSELSALVRSGHLDALSEFVALHPTIVDQRFGDDAQSRTALHLATDWPGHWPRVAQTIALLVAAGAPVNGRFAGPHTETPLHWAASSDDVEAIDALLDAGADIEADGAVFTGGTPLSDAVVFAQWRAARRLVERGASMTLWQAAALGEDATLARLLASGSVAADEVTNAGWHACRAGQLATVRMLSDAGADLDWLGHDGLTSRQAGLASDRPELVAWLTSLPGSPRDDTSFSEMT